MYVWHKCLTKKNYLPSVEEISRSISQQRDSMRYILFRKSKLAVNHSAVSGKLSAHIRQAGSHISVVPTIWHTVKKRRRQICLALTWPYWLTGYYISGTLVQSAWFARIRCSRGDKEVSTGKIKPGTLSSPSLYQCILCSWQTQYDTIVPR